MWGVGQAEIGMGRREVEVGWRSECVIERAGASPKDTNFHACRATCALLRT